MPLAPTMPLSAHFTAFELGADKPEATDAIVANLRLTAAGLERIRSALQSRLQINTPEHRNRGFRTAETNAEVGGSPSSDHVNGLSADFVPLDFGGDTVQAYQILRDSDLGNFDQIIFYPLKGHIHAGFGGNRREFRVHWTESAGGTPLLGSNFVQQLGGAVAYAAKGNTVGAVAILAAIIFTIVAINDR